MEVHDLITEWEYNFAQSTIPHSNPKHNKTAGQKWCVREIGTPLRSERKHSFRDYSYRNSYHPSATIHDAGHRREIKTMMNEAKMNELTQAEDMAYFRADLCCYSPESYTLEEKKEICNDMMATSKAVLDAMREDFERLPPDARAKLLDMLCASGVESPQWWWDVLVGDGDPLYRELEPLS